MIKNSLLIVALVVVGLGCDISKLVNNGKSDDPNPPRTTPTVEAKPSPANSPKPSATPATSSLIDILKRSKGKYPYQAKLLEIPDLKERLKKLMGSEFAAMKKYWNVESPFEIENDVLMASGCEAHNCGSNHYFLFVDLKNDDINVYHQEDSGTKHYYERGEIKLPTKFADDLGDDHHDDR